MQLSTNSVLVFPQHCNSIIEKKKVISGKQIYLYIYIFFTYRHILVELECLT